MLFLRRRRALALGLARAGGCSEHRSASAASSDTVGVVKAALARSEFRWDSVRAKDFTIYAPRGSYAASEVAAFQPAIQEAIPGTNRWADHEPSLDLCGRDIQRIYAASPAAIERGWHDWLRATTDARLASVAALRQLGCAPPR